MARSNPGATPSAIVASTGRAPIAATSQRLAAMARWPTTARGSSSRVEVHAVDQRVGRDHATMRTRRLPERRRRRRCPRCVARAPPGCGSSTIARERRDQLVFGQRAPRADAALGACSRSRAVRPPDRPRRRCSNPSRDVSRPRARPRAMFSRPMPPSTSRSQAGLRASISAAPRATFLSAFGMNDWPPNPGLTLMIRIRSTVLDDVLQASRPGSTGSERDAGLRAERRECARAGAANACVAS